MFHRVNAPFLLRVYCAFYQIMIVVLGHHFTSYFQRRVVLLVFAMTVILCGLIYFQVNFPPFCRYSFSFEENQRSSHKLYSGYRRFFVAFHEQFWC